MQSAPYDLPTEAFLPLSYEESEFIVAKSPAHQTRDGFTWATNFPISSATSRLPLWPGSLWGSPITSRDSGLFARRTDFVPLTIGRGGLVVALVAPCFFSVRLLLGIKSI